jgi:serine/threonine protein phosphatase PrpC
MTVCNVGDSRVVLGHYGEKQNGNKSSAENETVEEEKTEITAEEPSPQSMAGLSLVAKPLSIDQTPFRKDERDRVKKAGAEIKTIDMVEGRADFHEDWGDFTLGEHIDERGDPPRVWVKGESYPGTAFTRSLGDRLGENVGVYAEPEMESRYITKNDKYLVIASDGVYEFLPNQVVINLCESAATPLQACETITNAAYEKWLHYERRTDDITVIVCFLESTYDPDAEKNAGK